MKKGDLNVQNWGFAKLSGILCLRDVANKQTESAAR